jgi:hypothetical protein
MARVLEVIWGKRERKSFCKEDWTGEITLIRFNKFRRARKRRSSQRVRPLAGPMTGSTNLKG